MKFKIGDIVKIDGDVANCKKLQWYSNEIYTIINIDKDVAELDKALKNIETNKININYLKLLKIERKNKLLKLKDIYLV